jgi:hypothetical protein
MKIKKKKRKKEKKGDKWILFIFYCIDIWFFSK